MAYPQKPREASNKQKLNKYLQAVNRQREEAVVRRTSQERRLHRKHPELATYHEQPAGILKR